MEFDFVSRGFGVNMDMKYNTDIKEMVIKLGPGTPLDQYLEYYRQTVEGRNALNWFGLNATDAEFVEWHNAYRKSPLSAIMFA